MKVVILAGGLGTRISEETMDKPKPMVLIGDKPILWHLMNIFSIQGFNDFIIATGYKHEVIENWVEELNYICDWKIDPFFTGYDSQTGGRIKKCMEKYRDQQLIVTYGDGLGNISMSKLMKFHHNHGRLATLTAVRPPARFGYLNIENSRVTRFGEKNQTDAGWINGGFFVLEPIVSNYILNSLEPFESGALTRLVEKNQLMAYQHDDFWQPMDTLREKIELEKLNKNKQPPWLKI